MPYPSACHYLNIFVMYYLETHQTSRRLNIYSSEMISGLITLNGGVYRGAAEADIILHSNDELVAHCSRNWGCWRNEYKKYPL